MSRLSLAIAILDENLKGPNARFDERGLGVVRAAWEEAKTILAAEWQPASSAPQETDVWGWRPPPDHVPAGYGDIEIVRLEEGVWFDAGGEPIEPVLLWAKANKPAPPLIDPRPKGQRQ